MAIKIGFVLDKGGVGKTTSAVNVAAFLATMGKRVLALDLTTEANLTVSFGFDVQALDIGMCRVFDGDAISKNTFTVFENLDICPSKPDLNEIIFNAKIFAHAKKNEILKYRIKEVEDRYDIIIMDTPPASQHILTMNCLGAADYIILPMQLEYLAFTGFGHILDTIKRVRDEEWLNPDLKIMGLLGTFYQNTNNSKEHAKDLDEEFSKNFNVFKTKIRKNVALSECVRTGIPICRYDKNCHGYEDYENVTKEILEYVQNNGSH